MLHSKLILPCIDESINESKIWKAFQKLFLVTFLKCLYNAPIIIRDINNFGVFVPNFVETNYFTSFSSSKEVFNVAHIKIQR